MGGALAQVGVDLADVGGGVGLEDRVSGGCQAGGSAVPESAQAACRAAPSATYSAERRQRDGAAEDGRRERAQGGAAGRAADA